MQLKSMSCVELDGYCAVYSNNTGNNRVCQYIICAQNPKILNLPNSLHLINNTIEYISILSCFQKLLRHSATITAYILRTTHANAYNQDALSSYKCQNKMH